MATKSWEIMGTHCINIHGKCGKIVKPCRDVRKTDPIYGSNCYMQFKTLDNIYICKVCDIPA
jgi:hypothetical protein